MSASIAIAGLSWATPDGRTLFQDIDLSLGPERVGLVGRNGVGKTTLLRLITGDLQPLAGTVTCHGRIGILRQSVAAPEGTTLADLFGVRGTLAVLARAERGDASADELAEIDWGLPARMQAALARLGLDLGPEAALAALSGGQVTRARLAALVFAQPDMLLLDEPTNNLDREGRAAVAAFLAGWRKGAIVVSHDREVLNAMDAIVELTTIGATRHGGSWDEFRERKQAELEAAEQTLGDAQKRLALIQRTAQLRAERQDRRDRGGRRKAAKGDMPAILQGARKTRAEATRGDDSRLAQRQQEDAAAAATEARRKIEVLQPFSVEVAPTGLAAGKVVLRLDSVTTGHVPGRPAVSDVSLQLTGPERVALVGPNGSGKTTLLALATGRLPAWRGSVHRPVPFAMLDQDVGLLERSDSIASNFRRLNPGMDENGCRAALARFMFRADAALQPVADLSGGQVLRAGLACVLGGEAPPPLLILDEPTNHLDMDTVAELESGLRAYDGALLVVSHDEAFLDAIGIGRRIGMAAGRITDGDDGT